jgi:hypothetical protein
MEDLGTWVGRLRGAVAEHKDWPEKEAEQSSRNPTLSKYGVLGDFKSTTKSRFLDRYGVTTPD